jgi:GMP synthase (glutamine-hydrolysing)
MQVLALQFGAKLVEDKQIGMINVKTFKQNPLFSGDFQAYNLHQNNVDKLDEFNIIAEPRQAIKHKKKEFYGVLFHPEVRNSKIIDRFLE